MMAIQVSKLRYLELPVLLDLIRIRMDWLIKMPIVMPIVENTRQKKIYDLRYHETEGALVTTDIK